MYQSNIGKTYYATKIPNITRVTYSKLYTYFNAAQGGQRYEGSAMMDMSQVVTHKSSGLGGPGLSEYSKMVE